MRHWQKRFWKKIAIGEPDECWKWQMSTDKDGYGKTYRHAKHLRAHRVAWQLAHGDCAIPDGKQVLHSCDTPACCNPEHLRIGTPQDNMDDKHARGRERYLRGEENPMAKLDERKVTEIRRIYRDQKISHQKIADMFGVCNQLISDIITRKKWSHIPDPSLQLKLFKE